MEIALHLAGFVVLGAVIGLLGGIFGIGGGLFAIPILGLFFGFDEQHAQGTALVMVVPNVLLGLRDYARRGGFDRRLATMLALGGFPLTFLGAQVATHVPSSPLRVGFGIFLLAIAAYVLWRTFRRSPGTVVRGAALPPAPRGAAIGVGMAGGFVSGLFSVGGAVFAVPVISWLFAVTQATAQGLGLALVAPGAITSVVAYSLAHDIDWPIGLGLAVGGVFTVSRGVAIAHRTPEPVLRAAFAALIVVSALALIIRA